MPNKRRKEEIKYIYVLTNKYNGSYSGYFYLEDVIDSITVYSSFENASASLKSQGEDIGNNFVFKINSEASRAIYMSTDDYEEYSSKLEYKDNFYELLELLEKSKNNGGEPTFSIWEIDTYELDKCY